MSWFKKLLGVKTDEEIESCVSDEPTIRNARKALKRADGILENYQAAEDQRLERRAPSRSKQ